MSQPKPLRAAKGKSWGTSSPKKTEVNPPRTPKTRLPLLKQNDGSIDFCKLGHLLFHKRDEKLKRLKKAFGGD
jgi:hypothetical protein